VIFFSQADKISVLWGIFVCLERYLGWKDFIIWMNFATEWEKNRDSRATGNKQQAASSKQ
jgi:hypothetical protein